MNQSGNLTGALLQNLSVTVTHAHLSSRYPGWNRLNETPSFNRLYFIDGGEGKVILNGQAHYPRPGQLMIMPAGSTQTTETSPDNPYKRYFCHFDAHIGEWPLFHTGNKLYISDVAEPDAIREIFTEMITRFPEENLLSTMRNQAALLHLLALCLEDGGYSDFMGELAHTNGQKQLANVLQYIEQRLTQPMEVEELAELVHLHPNYFIPYFKKYMGFRPCIMCSSSGWNWLKDSSLTLLPAFPISLRRWAWSWPISRNISRNLPAYLPLPTGTAQGRGEKRTMRVQGDEPAEIQVPRAVTSRLSQPAAVFTH